MRIDSEVDINLISEYDLEFNDCLNDIDILCNELSQLHEEEQLNKREITNIDDIDEGPKIKIVYPKEYFENSDRRIVKYCDFNYMFILFAMYVYCYNYLYVIQYMKNSKIYSKCYH